MIQEFKKFIMRGNVVDLAVGIIIGTAFKDITTSLVKDIITPPIGQIINDDSFESLFISLDGMSYPSLEAAKDAGAATINIGSFINVTLDFLITAVAVFILIRAVNRLNEAVEDLMDDDEPEPELAPEPEPEPEPDPEPTTEEKLVVVLEKLSAQLDKA